MCTAASVRSRHAIISINPYHKRAKTMNKMQEQQILDYYSTTDKYIRSKSMYDCGKIVTLNNSANRELTVCKSFLTAFSKVCQSLLIDDFL